MLDRDLAGLYGVETRTLVQTVMRNRERFPRDFMFQLNQEEFINWRSQFVMSNSEKRGLRRPPYVFTEQGVAMLSSVLRSKRAVLVNIQIIRAFMHHQLTPKHDLLPYCHLHKYEWLSEAGVSPAQTRYCNSSALAEGKSGRLSYSSITPVFEAKTRLLVCPCWIGSC